MNNARQYSIRQLSWQLCLDNKAARVLLFERRQLLFSWNVNPFTDLGVGDVDRHNRPSPEDLELGILRLWS